ncbi:putative papain-like cysteine peptidase superfamily [Helianthus annuus]|uniref:Papain-like cysteine peptidase superfamily n=1 Tax=Helianthus annuus TaxID=4232 RepID=A0A9K3DIH6_HELAN|nr:putative papain-like cysteine peptidase superfamily [Helianthus annuus]KAJ0428579.1 putative papain-like cysteine peptidase superfamily [Helianthus annuus]KAJ0432698.1 putative papain-like cysteine peptidase superfamily [Helianthus annuus]KAJ0667106.1 putative papain-like cysteine peptidase superfamily [Helianthus annuus]KAJ0823905.1 putative papain-like cysteine peptidase superfamily [Helianthus annuus]
MRSPLESLLPGITVHIAVISAWAELLNYEERCRQKRSITRLFCSVNMLNENDYMSTEKIRATTFTENMEYVLLSADVKNIRDMSLVFVPVLHDEHLYCVCFNLRDNKVDVLDNSIADVSFKGKYNERPEKLVRSLFYKLQMSFVNILKHKCLMIA